MDTLFSIMISSIVIFQEVIMEEDVTSDFNTDGDCRCADPPKPPPAPPHFFCNELPDAHMCMSEMSMESHSASEPGSMAVLIVCVLLMVAFLVAGLMIWRHKKKVQTLLPCHKQPPPRREIPCPTEDTTMFRPQGQNNRETLAINNALERGREILNDMKILNYGCADKLIPNHGILYVKAKDKEHFNPIYEEVSACSDSKMHPCEEDSDDTQHEVATIGSEEDYTEDEVDLMDYEKRLSQESRLDSGSVCSSSSENKSPKSSPSLRTSSGSLHSKSSGISLPRFATKEGGITVPEQPRTKMGYQGIRTSLPRDYRHKPPPPKDLPKHPTTLPYVPKREWQRVPANSNTYPRPRSSSSNNGSQSSLPQSDHSSSPSASSESISDSEHQSAFVRDRTELGLAKNQRRTSFSKSDPRDETTPLTLQNRGRLPNSKMNYSGSNPSHKYRNTKPQPAPRYRMRQNQVPRLHPPFSHNSLSRGGDSNQEAAQWNAQFSEGEKRKPNYNDSLRKSRFSERDRRPPFPERSKRNSQYSDSLKRNSFGKRNSHLSDSERHYSHHSDGERQNSWVKDDPRISDVEHSNYQLSDSETPSSALRNASGLPPETLTELKTKLKRFNPSPRSNAPSVSQERIC